MNNDDKNTKKSFSEKAQDFFTKSTDSLDNLSQSLVKKMNDRDNQNIDDFVKNLSKSTDENIDSIEKKEKIDFVGGILKAQLVEEKLVLKLQLYFQDANEKVILKEITQDFSSSNLSQESKNELSNGNILEYPVNKSTVSHE